MGRTAAAKKAVEKPTAPAVRVPGAVKKDEMLETIRAHAFHTINIAEAENESIYVPVNVHGTEKNGAPFDINMKIMRGEDVPNVPRAACLALYQAVETRYSQKKKRGKKGGNLMVPARKKSYPFSIVESYDAKIETDNAPVELGEDEG